LRGAFRKPRRRSVEELSPNRLRDRRSTCILGGLMETTYTTCPHTNPARVRAGRRLDGDARGTALGFDALVWRLVR
jgi:hypothetical protein